MYPLEYYHVLSVTRIALDHLVSGLEAHVRDVLDRQSLVVSLLSGDERGISSQREVDTRVRDKIGLELGKVDVQSAVETERGGDRGHDLENNS